MKNNQSLILFGVMSVFLSLAPISPEPHLWGKLKWVAGGAVGMGPMDWFDLVLHGGPVSLFLIFLILRLSKKSRSAADAKG